MPQWPDAVGFGVFAVLVLASVVSDFHDSEYIIGGKYGKVNGNKAGKAATIAYNQCKNGEVLSSSMQTLLLQKLFPLSTPEDFKMVVSSI